MITLFEKDMRLLLTRKSTLVMFLVIGILFTWEFSNSFSGAYMTMLGALLALSTLSYDDMDHCMEFLFTLPCTRKQYALEKYLFVYGFSFVAGVVGLVIIIVASIMKGLPVTGGMIAEVVASELPILLAVGGLMIPVQLKFGAEKSRMVLLGVFGVIAILAFFLDQLESTSELVHGFVGKLDALSPLAVLGGLSGVLMLLTLVSFMITSRIMVNKEY